jgi:hypothetical protein
MIPGIDELCIVPSCMSLAPHCPNVPMPQYWILQWATAPFSLSHGPIIRESTVPASMVPLSIVPRPHCPIVALSMVPLSIAAWSIVQMSHCPIVSLPHYPVVHCPGARERSIVPVSQCPSVQAFLIPLSIVPLSYCPIVVLLVCPTVHCPSVPLSMVPFPGVPL